MKNKIENERVILWMDEGQITAMRQQLETLLPLAQNIVKTYLDLPFAETGIDFFNLYSNTESRADVFIKKQALDIPAPEHLSIDQNRYAALFRLPQLDAFVEAKQAFIQADGDRTVSYFRMKGKSVEIDPVAFERFAAQHTISVEEENKELYRVWTQMIAGLVEFNEFIRRDFTFMAGLSCPKLPVFLREDRTGKIVPNHEMFRTVAKQLQKHTS